MTVYGFSDPRLGATFDDADDLAAAKQKERRDRSLREPRGQFRVSLGVHLADQQLGSVLLRELVDQRCDLLARAAPARPEIEQHQPIAAPHQLGEILVGHADNPVTHVNILQGLLKRWRSRATPPRGGPNRAASSGLCWRRTPRGRAGGGPGRPCTEAPWPARQG